MPAGSLNVPVLAAATPAIVLTLALSAATAGGRLVTVSPKVVVTAAFTPSLAEMVTVCESSGPSVVAKLHDQVPAPLFCVSVPTEAVTVTVALPLASAKVPVLPAVWPSPTVTVAVSAATVGGEFTPVPVSAMSNGFSSKSLFAM